MKFKEMSVEEFKKDFSKFLNKIKVEDLINSLKKYAIIEKEYSYSQPLISEENYIIKYEIECDIKFGDKSNEYVYRNNYMNEHVHRKVEAA